VSMHIVFKLFSTLDFWAWKTMCTSTYGFQTQLNSRFFLLENPCMLMHMVFKLYSILDFRALKPMCVGAYGLQTLFNFRFLRFETHVLQHIWFSSFFQLWIF
jgi:hypothetical protein